MNPDTLTPQTIREKLSQQPFKDLHGHYPQGLLEGNPRPAAVLIPLVQDKNSWEVLFIRRTEVDGDIHSGQVALPGGRREQDDNSLEDAARRETNEELGISQDQIEILGRLNEFIAISNYRVTPFIGTLPWPYPIVTQDREVARWFTIPLAWLADPANRRTERRTLPDGMGEVNVIFFEEYDGEILWGLSARILTELLEVLGMRE